MISGMNGVPASGMGMVRRLLMLPAVMMLRRFTMMARSECVMF